MSAKREQFEPVEVVLEQRTECGFHAVNPNTDHCMKCGLPQRIGDQRSNDKSEPVYMEYPDDPHYQQFLTGLLKPQ